MSVTGRNAPLSPVSVGGSEWSVSSKYQPADDGQYPNSRTNLASPPNSGGSNGVMAMNGFPPGPRSNGGPSPPASVARSSNGTNMYARSEGRNSVRNELDDIVLGEHYVALRAFLLQRDPNHKQQPNKARDKLLRLSSVQFYELSTDVYDELIRRQSAARAPPNAPTAPPTYLLPETTFHPKRNQARQRLSSLGPPRFRDLAADVFHELERRFPRFAGGDIPRSGSPMSLRGPGGPGGPGPNGFPPRGQSRMRRPSDASSLRGPPPNDAYGVPPSPGVPNGEYGRPMPRQLNQNNTIVPNKSTMLEEDDDGGADDDGDAYGMDAASNRRQSKRSEGSGPTSEADRKVIEDYQTQVRELREKLDSMEDAMKKKEDEMNSMMDGERSRATTSDGEKEEWTNLRQGLENKLAEAQNLNNSMQQELDRMRQGHEAETRQLKDQMEELQQQQELQLQQLREQQGQQQQQEKAMNVNMSSSSGDSDLQRENEELRNSLREQQQVTEEVRREAQEFLREMRTLSEQSGSTWEKHTEMEKTIESLEREVQEWRNRYARTKTQLRDMRAPSEGLAADQDASKHLRDMGFADDDGLVKDVHVTKFQIAIDELLQKARGDDSDKVIDAMKSVVINVRRIMKDIDSSPPSDDETAQQRAKAKSKVSSTANSLITASKIFAAGAGLSPVSLVDAAASHLAGAIVEMLRIVKIRATPADELEDEDEGTMTPADSTGFFSPRSTTQVSAVPSNGLPPPPPFQGLVGVRGSIDSSAYSPLNSPRESVGPYRRGPNGMGYPNANNQQSPQGPNGYGAPQQQNNRAEDLKIYLEDQTAVLVSDIQNLVGTIRGDADIRQITTQIDSIDAVVSKIIAETHAGGCGDLVAGLADSKERLLESGDRGRDMAEAGVNTEDREWRMWTQTLPPIAFEIARETKELVQRVGNTA